MLAKDYFGQEIELDQKDTELLNQYVKSFNERKGPRVGDFVITPIGDLERFTHDWGDSLQTGAIGSSYSIGASGHISYSGGLNPSIELTRITDTEETRLGSVWFFHHGRPQAHSSRTVMIEFRVYRVK